MDKLLLAVGIGSAVPADVPAFAVWWRRRVTNGQGQLVDFGLEAVVVGADGIDDLPDGLVVAAADRFLRRGAGRLRDGQDDIAALLALRSAHHPAHGLHHVNVRFARMQEQDGVQRRHVHALGQAASIGQDVAHALLRLLAEPGQALGAVERVLRAVNVLHLAAQAVFGVVAGGGDAAVNHRREVLRESPWTA